MRRILASLGKRWQLGGVADEGDAESGVTTFWAKASSHAPRLVFSFPNVVLNRGTLSESDILCYLDQLETDGVFADRVSARVG